MKQLHNTARLLRIYAGLLVVGMLAGCFGGSLQGNPSRTRVEVADVRTVAGDWEGTVKKEHGIIPAGTVRLTIRDNGSYMFAGQTTSDVVLGAGHVEVRDGRLIGETDRRVLTLSLYDHKGEAMLVVESTNKQSGDRYHGEFTKTK